MPAQKLLYQICWWKNKTKTDFVLFILLEINFTKLKWVTCKTCKFHWCVSLFCIALQQTRLKWWSYFYITLDVCTITWLSFCKEPARQVISLFVICWSLLTSPASKHFFFMYDLQLLYQFPNFENFSCVGFCSKLKNAWNYVN